MSTLTKLVGASAAQEVQQIAISELSPSPDNPRRAMDEAFLAQLSDSIQQLGIQVPLLVRRMPGNAVNTDPGFEIVAGHRRYQAALKLDMPTTPVQTGRKVSFLC